MPAHLPVLRLALAAALLAATGCGQVEGGGSTAAADTAAPLLPPSEVAWAPLGSWSGTGNKETARFQVRAEEWRLVGQVQRLKKTEMPWIVVSVYDTARAQVANFSIEDVATDTSYVHVPPGVYYLTVGTYGARWTLSAEERRPVVERPEP